MKKRLVILFCLGGFFGSFFIGRCSVEIEPGSYQMNMIHEDFIPYIEEYVDLIGRKKENSDKEFLSVTIYKENENYRTTFQFTNFKQGAVLTTICGKILIYEEPPMSWLLKPNREWVLKNYPKFSHKDSMIDRKNSANTFNLEAGNFDTLEILVDPYGNIINHRIHFVDPSEFSTYILTRIL